MIREAERRDRDRIEELYKLLIPDDDEINVLAEQIEFIKQDADHFLFVYESEGTVVGTLLLSFCPDAMYGSRCYAVVENIIVDPAYRGAGAGKELMEYVEACCRKRNCRELMLASNLIRTRAHQFFERQGFSHVAKGFKKYLD